MLSLSDFDFYLPPELIAQTALAERSASRLLEVQTDPSTLETELIDRTFKALSECLLPNDLLIFNNTKVLKARLFGKKQSGGKVEILVERLIDNQHLLAQIRASKSPAPETTIRIAETFDVTVKKRIGEFYLLNFPSSCLPLIELYGQLPLPPYIEHIPTAEDEKRYQTIFAEKIGAVAAPTAGLHFDEALINTLTSQGIQTAMLTLHVGAGTFQPVRTNNLAEHQMHSEWFSLPASLIEKIAETKAKNGRIIAVGTTSLRALEAAATEAETQAKPLSATEAETNIFITPGYRFKIIDALITNFHLPKSTLLMLVSAFAGLKPIRQAYAHAIEQKYRFFSYGDAMFLKRLDRKN